ncbi:MarR family transcriptional regulator [Bacillus anthracis]|nr:MarR family transcriptional regulator [Bacillus anthracis]
MNEKRETLILELSGSFRKMIRLLQNDINTRFAEHMPYNEFSVLRALFLNSPQMASQIASEVNVTSSHITAVTDRFVRKGFVARSRSTSDRRVVYLEITEHGRDLVAKLEGVRKEYYKERFKGWSDQEIEMVLELFGRVL